VDTENDLKEKAALKKLNRKLKEVHEELQRHNTVCIIHLVLQWCKQGTILAHYDGYGLLDASYLWPVYNAFLISVLEVTGSGGCIWFIPSSSTLLCTHRRFTCGSDVLMQN
jgi:hypothetical protein